ncbi:Rap1a/Tai family immunity protein [Methylobacterium nigriterrae]|uniref:Rap1a/Tai family immunity protein n=1 Tax=Methylobacterium nigriterrae TaxID=3127512 RepID=UPI00301375CF
MLTSLAILLVAPPSVLRAEEKPASIEQGAPNGGSVDVTDRTTRSLAAACLAEQGEASGWCSAYLMGVADTLTALGIGGAKDGICDADYTIGSLAETFLTWARANDSLLRLDMLAGVSLAFRQRWPCR